MGVQGWEDRKCAACQLNHHAQGQAATPWRWQGRKLAEEGLLAACGGAYQLPTRALPFQAKKEKPERPWWHSPPRWPWKPEPKPKNPPKAHWPYTGRFDCAPNPQERTGRRIPVVGALLPIQWYCHRCRIECEHYCEREYDLSSSRNGDCVKECDARFALCHLSKKF